MVPEMWTSVTVAGGLKLVGSRVHALQVSIGRVQEKVSRPFTVMMTRTKQLARLQVGLLLSYALTDTVCQMSCELLRRTTRLLQLFKRLHAQHDAGPRDLPKVRPACT